MWSRLKTLRKRAPAGSARAATRLSPRVAFLLGVVSVFVVRAVVNVAPFADIAVRPLVLPDRPMPSDAIVVLGAGVTTECTPNLSGLRRVMKASELFRRGLAPHLVFTGGRPKGSACTIAETMARFAAMTGIPRDRMHLEPASTSTWENAQFSRPILDKLHIRRLLLVTDRLHVRRAAMVFSELGYTVGWVAVPVPETLADNVSMLFWGGREYAALLYYRIRLAWDSMDGRHAAASGRTAGRGNN